MWITILSDSSDAVRYSKPASWTRLAARHVFKQTGATARLDRILQARSAVDVDERSIWTLVANARSNSTRLVSAL